MSETTPQLKAIVAEFHDGMLAEYDHGMSDALTIVKKTFEQIAAHPELSEVMKPGINIAVLGIDTLIDEHSKIRNAKPEQV